MNFKTFKSQKWEPLVILTRQFKLKQWHLVGGSMGYVGLNDPRPPPPACTYMYLAGINITIHALPGQTCPATGFTPTLSLVHPATEHANDPPSLVLPCSGVHANTLPSLVHYCDSFYSCRMADWAGKCIAFHSYEWQIGPCTALVCALLQDVVGRAECILYSDVYLSLFSPCSLPHPPRTITTWRRVTGDGQPSCEYV
jgi:hypothetical protein